VLPAGKPGVLLAMSNQQLAALELLPEAAAAAAETRWTEGTAEVSA